jgi:hypothetical protein
MAPSSCKNEKAPERDRSPLAPVDNGGSLFERAGKAGECGLEIVAEALDDGDDGNGNAGRDQTIFDGSLKFIWLPKPTKWFTNRLE